MSLILNKRKFTEAALKHVEPGKDYDKDEVVARTAIDLVDKFYDEFSNEIATEDLPKLRNIYKGIAYNAIDWTSLNRKARPDEYADGAWRMAEEIAQMEANL